MYIIYYCIIIKHMYHNNTIKIVEVIWNIGETMTQIIEYSFRFILYVFFGLSLEVIFAVTGIENCLGKKANLNRRVPKKYLEGFVSLYMIPLHGFGLLFGFEGLYPVIISLPMPVRFLIWSIGITLMEVGWGIILYKVLGFYTWDYYKDSKFKVFKNGYTLYTLIPFWGIAGIILEQYSSLLIYLSPFVSEYFLK